MIKSAYIHIPFCENICHYCDFNKFYLKGQPVDAYLQALVQEMRMTLEQVPAEGFDTLFVGGGTPTSLNERQLSFFCETIDRYLPKNENCEFTFEANPGDLTKEKLQILKASGVNRISLGVQTFNNELLERIGRGHRKQDVIRTISSVKEMGFANISIDLMFSLPGQSLADFQETLDEAFKLEIPHYSGYSLIIEPKTVFYNLITKGALHLPDEDLEADMYGLLMREMEKHGFKQYEISNFSLPGYESRHNLTYWNNNEYYGFGAGAHSYMKGVRRANIGPLNHYIRTVAEGKLPLFEQHRETKAERMEEEMFLGLRKNTGVSISTFIRKFQVDPTTLFEKEISDLVQKGWLEVSNSHIYLTKKGRFLGNEVFQSFLGVSND